MEKYKPALLLAAAVVVALITSLAAYSWIQKKTASKETSLGTQAVAVAAVDLPWGAVLKKEMLKPVQFLQGSLPSGEYFTDPSTLQGRVLIAPMKANEPILKSRLAPETVSAGGVAAVVDPKKRAMAVKVDKVIGVSGFIHPGNRVDVLVTLARPGREAAPTTKIVLQNIVVLAAGSELDQKGKNEKPSQVDVITLEVTPEQAEKLALATTEGKVQLALRNYNNTEEISTAGVTLPNLLTGEGAPARMRPAKPAVAKRSSPVAAGPAPISVEVFHGSKKSTALFKGEQL